MFEFTQIRIAIAVLWLVSAIADYAHIAYIWQLKEYRIDRFYDFLKTKQGRLFFLTYRFIWRAILALGLLLVGAGTQKVMAYIVLLVLVLDAANNLRLATKGRILYPVPTMRAVHIVLLSTLAEAIIIMLSGRLNVILLFLLFRFFIGTALVLFMNMPVKAAKSLLIGKAHRKIQKYSNLTVIGITGSFGKTSVKEYCAHVLSQSYNVLKTPENTNTDIGVAKFILQYDFTDVDIFVVEMGAYRIGEIEKICSIVRPRIGILTAVSEQHLALFGSIKNIQTAKYELLRSLPEDGFAITNANNPYCTEFLHELTCKRKETFGTDEEIKPDFMILDIGSDLDGVQADAIYQNERIRFQAPVRGSHQPMNIAPVIMACRFILMPMSKILTAVSKLPERTGTGLHVFLYGTATIIDDSYNSNPDGFKSALDVMNKYSSDKERIIITRGMLELGERSDDLHQMMGEEIAFCADRLVIISPDFVEPLTAGIEHIKHSFKTEIMSIFEPDKLLVFIRSLKDKHVVILLENRMPKNIQEELAEYDH